jgi:hypothetical protein
VAKVIQPSIAEKMLADVDHEAKRDFYYRANLDIGSDLEKWCSKLNWRIVQSEKVLQPPKSLITSLPAYLVWEFTITTPDGEICFRPVGYNVAGANGRINMYSYPDMNEVMLLLQPDSTWKIRTHSGIDWPHPWNEKTFVELVNALLKTE